MVLSGGVWYIEHMADGEKKKVGPVKRFVRKTVALAAAGAITGGYVGHSQEKDTQAQIDEALASANPPSTQLCDATMERARDHTNNLIVGGAVLGAGLAAAGAAAGRGLENKRNALPREPGHHIADSRHPDHHHDKWRHIHEAQREARRGDNERQ